MSNEQQESVARYGWAWVLALILLFVILEAKAVTIAVHDRDGISLALTDEPCKLEAVSNLPNRATWTEKGITHEGCFFVHPAGIVVAYFNDRTIAIIPSQVFTRTNQI